MTCWERETNFEAVSKQIERKTDDKADTLVSRVVLMGHAGLKQVQSKVQGALELRPRRAGTGKRTKGAWGMPLAPGGEEGRDKLRKAAVRGKCPVTRGCPNGETRRA